MKKQSPYIRFKTLDACHPSSLWGFLSTCHKFCCWTGDGAAWRTKSIQSSVVVAKQIKAFPFYNKISAGLFHQFLHSLIFFTPVLSTLRLLQSPRCLLPLSSSPLSFSNHISHICGPLAHLSVLVGELWGLKVLKVQFIWITKIHILSFTPVAFIHANRFGSICWGFELALWDFLLQLQANVCEWNFVVVSILLWNYFIQKKNVVCEDLWL